MNEGAELLSLWMRKYKTSQKGLAERLGVTPQLVQLWLDGAKPNRPTAWARHAIEQMTGGYVPATAWLNESETARIERAAGNG